MYDNNKNDLVPFSIIKNIFGFFKRLFSRNKLINEISTIKTDEKVNSNFFMKDIKVENNTKSQFDMNLLEKYRKGDIDLDKMTDEQFECLCNTYEERISKLKDSNKTRKEKLVQYRKQLSNK